MKSLFERIGGKTAVLATVTKLYGRILEDEKLIPFFKDIDVESLRRSQYSFVQKAFGGSDSYSGKDLRLAHADLVKIGLDNDHFDAVAKHLEDTLIELGIPQDLRMEALLIVDSAREDVLGG
jgi:hemoglobin